MTVDLRARRKAAGLSLTDAAHLLQVERRVLGALEDGKPRRWRIDDPAGLAARARALYAGRDLPKLGPCATCAFRPQSPESEPFSAPAVAADGESQIAFLVDRQIRKRLALGQEPEPFHCHRWLPRYDDGSDPWTGDYDPQIKNGGHLRSAPLCVGFERAVAAVRAELSR